MNIAIMQPYFLPYLGYMQLLSASEIFVLYNDVNFIERGWIHRNNFLTHNGINKLSIPLEKASSKKLINEIEVAVNNKAYSKTITTLEQSYRKAPYFNDFFPDLKKLFDVDHGITIDILCKNILQLICDYLDIPTVLKNSSDLVYNRDLNREEKIINIAELENCKTILFPSGSKALYSDDVFEEKGFTSKVVMPTLTEYKQIKNKEFHNGLSILDIIMFNSKKEARAMVYTHEYSTLNE